MSEVEDYVREKFEERYQAYMDANQCPDCEVLMLLDDDKVTTWCGICGRRSTFTKPT